MNNLQQTLDKLMESVSRIEKALCEPKHTPTQAPLPEKTDIVPCRRPVGRPITKPKVTTPGIKGNPHNIEWHNMCKDYATRHNVTFYEAVKIVSPEYHRKKAEAVLKSI